jgi:preprotein translocase subunit Sss1
MYEQRFSEEDIEKVEAVFRSTNVLDKQKITKLTRKAVRAKKENISYLEHINKILQIAKKPETKDNGTNKFDHIRQTLFYVNKNE